MQNTWNIWQGRRVFQNEHALADEIIHAARCKKADAVREYVARLPADLRAWLLVNLPPSMTEEQRVLVYLALADEALQALRADDHAQAQQCLEQMPPALGEWLCNHLPDDLDRRQRDIVLSVWEPELFPDEEPAREPEPREGEVAMPVLTETRKCRLCDQQIHVFRDVEGIVHFLSVASVVWRGRTRYALPHTADCPEYEAWLQQQQAESEG